MVYLIMGLRCYCKGSPKQWVSSHPLFSLPAGRTHHHDNQQGYFEWLGLSDSCFMLSGRSRWLEAPYGVVSRRDLAKNTSRDDI